MLGVRLNSDSQMRSGFIARQIYGISPDALEGAAGTLRCVPLAGTAREDARAFATEISKGFCSWR